MDSITKKCSKCGEYKDVSQYIKDPSKKDGLYSSCKSCYKIFYKATADKYKPVRSEYRITNRDEILNRRRKRYYENRDENLRKLNEWHKKNKDKEKAYRIENKEKLDATSKAWTKKNKDRVNENIRNWRKDNKDKVSVQKNNRRVAESTGRITNDEWISVLEKYGNKCLCCGRSDVRITLDHVIPLCKGGKNTIDNAQPLCKSCNSRKSQKTIDYRKEV